MVLLFCLITLKVRQVSNLENHFEKNLRNLEESGEFLGEARGGEMIWGKIQKGRGYS